MRAALAFIALAACYTPDKLDCTVTCNAARECAQGQVCGADGFCAAPDVAGHCSATDAMPAQHVTLVVAISGPGTVTVDGIGTCNDDHGCMFDVPAGTQRSLVAKPEKQDKAFAGWSDACDGQPATCALVPTAPMTRVGARFE
jgi:hypothetical protein